MLWCFIFKFISRWILQVGEARNSYKCQAQLARKSESRSQYAGLNFFFSLVLEKIPNSIRQTWIFPDSTRIALAPGIQAPNPLIRVPWPMTFRGTWRNVLLGRDPRGLRERSKGRGIGTPISLENDPANEICLLPNAGYMFRINDSRFYGVSWSRR